MKIVLAGGGTAGHIEPAMNVADAIVAKYPQAQIVALGTAKGLETELVPKRGYALELIEATPLPRRVNTDLISLPHRLSKAIAQCRQVLKGADVLIGFGGYVALPAYFAARGKVPILVHEANAKPGLANRVGSRFATAIAETVAGSLSDAVQTGIPLRESIANFDRASLRDQAKEYFEITSSKPTLLVFGGSQGAVSINRVLEQARQQQLLDNFEVIHSVGAKNEVPSKLAANYRALNYIDRMDLAYAAADFAICRSGAMTVAEISAVGLPACYVPFPIGNGEQRLNAAAVVAAGGALCVSDASFSSEFVRAEVLPILADSSRLADMAQITASFGRQDASTRILQIVEQILADSE